MRITSTNVHGFSTIEESAEYIIGAQQFDSDISCFQEVNLDTHNIDVIQGIRKSVNSIEESKGSAFQLSSTRKLNHKGIRKMGGTMIHVAKKWTGSNLQMSSEKFGRWSRISLEGKGEQKLSIFSVYRVCENTLDEAGGDTVWMQQYSALFEAGIRQPKPRQQILNDLEIEIQQLRKDKNHQIIVGIDANESSRQKGTSRIRDFAINTGLIDCHHYFHPELPETPTHAEGSKQIDYCFVSPGIIPSVTRCGILPLNYAAQSDHRSLYIDIDTTCVLGGKWKEPRGPPVRGLVLKNIKALSTYKNKLCEYWKQHRMQEKMEAIIHSLQGISKDHITQSEIESVREKIDKWDTLATELMMASERRCRRTGITKTYLWSKPLMLAGQRVTYWKIRKQSKKNGSSEYKKGYAAYLQQIFKYNNEEMTEDEIRIQLKEAWKNLREVQKEDRKHRDAFLEELAKKRAEEQNIRVESAIKQIRNAEAASEVHEKFNYYLKDTRRGAIDHLLIPVGTDPQGAFGKKWRKVTDETEVEEILLQRNEAKLRESKISPFSTSSHTSLGTSIGHMGDTEAVEKILKGEYKIGDDISQRYDAEELTIFIEELAQYSTAVTTINPVITTQNLRDVFNKTKEFTSSSPSNAHIGLWQATLQIEHIAETLAASTTIPFLYGFAKRRWKRGIHVMLQKIKRPYTHKLQIVQLFEVDFNAALKIYYSRRMMSNSVASSLNPDQIYAGIKGNTVHDCLVNLQLTYESSFISRTPMAIIFNDMAGCYDRLRMNLTTITTRRLGMDRNVAKAHSETLTEMQHTIRTSNGDSSKNIIPDNEFGGTGQGSGGSPPICYSQLIPMVRTLERITPGQLIQDPTRTIQVLQHVINWVDDTVNKEILDMNLGTMEQLQRIRDILIHWRRIVRITGGDLELSKTLVYLLDYKFLEGGKYIRHKSVSETPGDIMMPVELQQDKESKITRAEPNQAERYVGVRISPNGQMETEFEFRMDQARNLGYKLARIFMTRPEATLAYQSRWLSVLGFFAPITYFTRLQSAKIQTPIYQALLPKMGYNRHIPLSIRYGPDKYGGIGLTHVYTEQVVKHIQFLVGTLRQKTELSDTMVIVLSNTQLSVGTMDLFLNVEKKKISYIDGRSRTMSLWKMSNEFNITYDIDRVWKPTPQREGELTLMDLFLANRISRDGLRIMNECRNYLQVIYVSDITSADGKTILKWAIHPPNDLQNRSNLRWRYQPRPDDDKWITWRDILMRTIGVTTDYENIWHLKKPLGKWIHMDHHITRRYQIHTPTGQLWDTQQNKVYRHTWHSNMFRSYAEEGIAPVLDMTPADIIMTTQGIEVRYDDRNTTYNVTPSVPTSTLQVIGSLPYSVQNIIQGFNVPQDDGRAIIRSLLTHSLYAASDGSVRSNEGAFGYLFTDGDRTYTQKGYGRVPVTQNNITSQRAEFYGAAAVVTILEVLIRRFNIQQRCATTIYLDNRSVTEYQTQGAIKKGLKSHLASDTDIQMYIREVIDRTTLDITWEWVRGHQDDNKDIKDLTFAEHLNIETDEIADEGYRLHLQHQAHLPGSRLSVYIDNEYVSDDNMRQNISHKDHTAPLQEYLQGKHGWDDRIMDLIDWDMQEEVMDKRSIHEKTNIVKYIHGWQHVGRQKFLFNEKTTEAKCKLCGEVEQQHHYMKCPCEEWHTHIQKVWKLLKGKLQRSHTHPHIISTISHIIHQKHSPNIYDLRKEHTRHASIDKAIVDQHQIGWINMFLGRVSKQWGRTQYQYFLDNPAYRSPGPYSLEQSYSKWRKSFGLSLIQYGLDLWVERNNKVHGDTPTNQRFMLRINTIKKAQELFSEGEDSVPPGQRRLFCNFERRIERSTKSILGWIDMVTLAQAKRKEDLKTMETQPTVDTYFQILPQPPPRRHTQRHIQRLQQNTTRVSDNRSLWAQQDLRRLFLRPQPNVRYRKP